MIVFFGFLNLFYEISYMVLFLGFILNNCFIGNFFSFGIFGFFFVFENCVNSYNFGFGEIFVLDRYFIDNFFGFIVNNNIGIGNLRVVIDDIIFVFLYGFGLIGGSSNLVINNGVDVLLFFVLLNFGLFGGLMLMLES